MSLQNLAGISVARANKTFKISERDGTGGGIAETSDPLLVKAVHKLTSVRLHSAGAVTLLLRSLFKRDLTVLSPTPAQTLACPYPYHFPQGQRCT